MGLDPTPDLYKQMWLKKIFKKTDQSAVFLSSADRIGTWIVRSMKLKSERSNLLCVATTWWARPSRRSRLKMLPPPLWPNSWLWGGGGVWGSFFVTVCTSTDQMLDSQTEPSALQYPCVTFNPFFSFSGRMWPDWFRSLTAYLKILKRWPIVAFCTTILVYLENIILFYKST
jgi:hypothetical protein